MPPTDPIDWASRTWERVAGLASGRGVYDNIAEAYLFLMRHWRDGFDRVYLFGFSRGAFTARSVAGMVNLFGILEPQHEEMLPTLIRIYFSRDEAGSNFMMKSWPPALRKTWSLRWRSRRHPPWKQFAVPSRARPPPPPSRGPSRARKETHEKGNAH